MMLNCGILMENSEASRYINYIDFPSLLKFIEDRQNLLLLVSFIQLLYFCFLLGYQLDGD